MAEGMDVKALRENPELFRSLLKNAIEEITAGTSYHWGVEINNVLCKILPVHFEHKPSWAFLVPLPGGTKGISNWCEEGAANPTNLHHQLLQETLKKAIFPRIDETWDKLEISQKVSYLHQLEQQYPSDFVAWRPTADEIAIRRLKGFHLTQLKARMEHKLKKYKAENEKIKKELIAKGTTMKGALEKIVKAEDNLSHLYTDYEKLTKLDD